MQINLDVFVNGGTVRVSIYMELKKGEKKYKITPLSFVERFFSPILVPETSGFQTTNTSPSTAKAPVQEAQQIMSSC